jgi:D-inositol-3-phosphate glycosyltransferase
VSTTTEPLHIGLVSLHTSPGDEPGSGEVGGMNVVVRHQAEALADLGHHVDIITRRSAPTQPDSVSLVPGVCLRFLSAGPAEPVPKGEHDAFIEPFRHELEQLGRFDVLHSHHWFSGAAALPVARERGIPHVQSFHSIAADPATPLSEGERPESAGRIAGEELLARESDAVVVVSEAEASTVRTRLGGGAEDGAVDRRGWRRAPRRHPLRGRCGARATAQGPGPGDRGDREHQPGGPPHPGHRGRRLE